MDRDTYFDNAATTPPDPRVLAEVLAALESHWGNAHSIHGWGREADAAVERARTRLASLLGVAAEELYFTSGATESNNWVLQAHPDAAVSPFEHSSIAEPAETLGCQVLPNKDLELCAPEEEVELISVMAVNNEIGAILDAPSQDQALAHCDATQAVGKVRVDLSHLDFASLSAHKFYGPKGVGALYARDGAAPEPLILGGGQEHGARAGTLNVPGIVGLGAAAAIAEDELDSNYALVQELRSCVLERLRPCSDWLVNGGENVSPYILSVSFLDVEGESLVVELDRLGFAISSGAACSTGSTEPSRVLSALGLETQWLRGTVRISFGKWNTLEAASELGEALVGAVGGLRKLRTF